MLAGGGRGWEAEEEEQARGNQMRRRSLIFLLQGLIVFRQLLKDISSLFFDKLYAPISSIYIPVV